MTQQSDHALMVQALQKIAQVLIPMKKGEQFLPYWTTKIVERAGVDLLTKAGCSPNMAEAKKTAAKTRVAEDLTYQEIMLVFVYLQDRLATIGLQWDKHMQAEERKKVLDATPMEI